LRQQVTETAHPNTVAVWWRQATRTKRHLSPLAKADTVQFPHLDERKEMMADLMLVDRWTNLRSVLFRNGAALFLAQERRHIYAAFSDCLFYLD
jgi:hypothetical protein